MRGRELRGLVHIADWYATFAALGGVAADDPGAPAPVDGVDQDADGALWKLIVGPAQQATWYGSAQETFTPNASDPHPSYTAYVDCTPPDVCLFNLAADPTEHVNVAKTRADSNPPDDTAGLCAAVSRTGGYMAPVGEEAGGRCRCRGGRALATDTVAPAAQDTYQPPPPPPPPPPGSM
eukprot:gene52873-17716_t